VINVQYDKVIIDEFSPVVVYRAVAAYVLLFKYKYASHCDEWSRQACVCSVTVMNQLPLTI